MLSGKQKRALAATLVSSLYLLLSIAIVEQILQAERAKQMNLARSNVNLQLMTAKGALESAVVLDAYVGNSVATLATVAPDVVEKNWSVIGRQFMEKATHARSVALAPNDVIAYIYPLQGNEKALGLDLRSQAEQYNIIQQARNRQTVIIAGPVRLVERVGHLDRDVERVVNGQRAAAQAIGERLALGAEHDRAIGDREDDIVAVGTAAVVALTGSAAGRLLMRTMVEADEGRDAGIHDEDDIAASAAARR